MQQLATLGKTLPAFWWSSVNLNDPQVRDIFLERLRGWVWPVGELIKKIVHPLEWSPSLHHLLVQQWWSGYTQTLLNQVDATINGICTGSFLWADNRVYTDQTSCVLTYTPFYKWMIDSMQTYKSQKVQKDEQILDWASVQIRSAPFLRQSPPPGARDLLQAMQISF
jgi:deoxyribodipyrimidine photolyase